MKLSKLILCATLLISGAANATPITFTYTGEITSIDASLAGLISVGDVATIEVIADNGSSSAISQTWDVLDTISAIFTAGAYSLTHSDGWFTSDFATGFSTDAAGNLTVTNWVGIRVDATAFDTFGAGGDLNNGLGRASNGGGFTYTPDLPTVSAWSIGPAGTVSAPATLALLGMGLAGLGWSRRKKA